ncbi:cupin domain-containing protein [Rhizobium lusitanum]|uniref:Cupin domain protein n=1 Tax=Rhizobium lusitanum TaxID=293958 RepID=A0A1C3UUW3_9HYPH|nr:cupin domain-containing protein [Rhizobium lusitanum]SCB19245.1 Cupin domain protein [Rhizobium lusitanum]
MDQTTPSQSPAIHRAGTVVQRSPDRIASAPFWVEMLVENSEDGGLTAMRCTIEPGVMTRWHTHPHGQILYVLSGVGIAERHGGPAEELRAGDCITFAPNERHRHGAAPESTFAYISIQAAQDGSAVTWLEE